MKEKGDLLSDSHIILYSWEKYFSQILSVYSVSDVRQRDIHTAESLEPDPPTKGIHNFRDRCCFLYNSYSSTMQH
jgi:hypothetical protein